MGPLVAGQLSNGVRCRTIRHVESREGRDRYALLASPYFAGELACG